MILDSAKISLQDGSEIAAIDVQPGRSLAAHKKLGAVLKNRTIENRLDVVGLVLSNGNKLCGSMDQKVAVIRTHAASKSVRSSHRCATSPVPSVSAAEPSRVPVTIAPTCSGENPSSVRYTASTTDTNPSANPRNARATITRGTSTVAEPGRSRRRAIVRSVCVTCWSPFGHPDRTSDR